MEAPSGDKGRLSGKFAGFEHQPSAEVWSRIANKADERPGALTGRFSAFEQAPNALLWGKIASQIKPFHARPSVRWMAAASVVVAVGLGIWAGWPQQPQGKTEEPGNMAQWVAATPRPDSARLQTPNTFLMHKDFMLWMPNSMDWMPICGGVQVVGPWPSNLTLQQNPSENPQEKAAIDTIMVAEASESKPDTLGTIYPEIEFPKGNEAEAAFGLALGSNFAPAGMTSSPLQFTSTRNEDYLGTPIISNNSENARINEHFQTPLMFGLTAEVPLGKRLRLLPGLVYTLMRSTAAGGATKITRHYLGLNLSGSMDVLRGKKTSAYVLAGMQFDAGLATDIRHEEGSNSPLEGLELNPGNHLAGIVGAGVNRMVTRHIGIYAQANASSYVWQSESNLWTSKSIWPSAQLGLRVRM